MGANWQKLEDWLSKREATMAAVRTVGSVVAALAGVTVFLKIFGLI